MADESKPDGPAVGERACEACGAVRRLTPKNFPRVPGTQHTLRSICRVCYRAQKNKRTLEKMENAATRTFVKAASRGGARIPHTSEMLESIMTLFGGSQGLASVLAQQYYAAPAGGRIRNSILEMILKLVTKTAETGGTTKPTSLMTDEELEAALAQRLENAVSARKNMALLKEQAPDLLSIGNTLTAADLAMVPAVTHDAAQP